MKIEKPYSFEGPNGRQSLLDLFEGRAQLILYHFMFGPKVDGWPEKGCPGCSFVADQISHLDHIHARDITFAMVSLVPLADIQRLRENYEWKRWPWYSATEAFNRDLDVSDESGNSFGLNVFYRDGADVYRTHFVARRGLEAFGTANTTPMPSAGRVEPCVRARSREFALASTSRSGDPSDTFPRKRFSTAV